MMPRNVAAQLPHVWRCRSEYKSLQRQHAMIAETLAAPPPDEFSAQHLAILRNLRATWLTVESGAPGMRQFLPFCANRSTLKVGFELIGCRNDALLARALVETGQLIPAFCTKAGMSAGRYAAPADMRNYWLRPQLSSQSLRRGMATSAYRAGADFRDIKRQGGWRHNGTVQGYIEEAGRFEENAAGSLLRQDETPATGTKSPKR